MANSKTYLMIGAGVGVGALVVCKWIKNEKPSLWELIGSGLAGAAFGLLPDLLEPATGPNHRRFFHSYATAGLIGWANIKAWQDPALLERDKLSLTIASSSYISHLLADSGTPKRIPII